MNIQESAYKVTMMLCKAYKLRNRRDYKILSDDPVYIIRRLCNTELDMLTAVDSRETVKGFNLAFNKMMS